MKQKRLVLPGARDRWLMGGQGTKRNCSKKGARGQKDAHTGHCSGFQCSLLKMFMKSKPLVFKMITFVIKVDDRFTDLAFKYLVNSWSFCAVLRFFSNWDVGAKQHLLHFISPWKEFHLICCILLFFESISQRFGSKFAQKLCHKDRCLCLCLSVSAC